MATLFIAVVALGLSVTNSYVQWQAYRRDRVDVLVDVSWAMPTYTMPDGSVRVGDGRVAVTATNVGRQPAVVNGMGFDTTDGHSIALTEAQPGDVLPAVLQPGEHREMWVQSDELERVLQENHARLKSANVHGPGGQRWEATKLGGISKLGG